MNKLTLILALLLFSNPFANTANTKCNEITQDEKNLTEKEDKGIHFFKGTWEELLAKAKAENKPIFVDVYTVWCGPCKAMVRNVFPVAEVGAYYNARFINYKLDAEDKSMNGPALANKYGVNSYPTFLYLKPNGDLINSKSSVLNVTGLIDLAKSTLGEKELSDYKSLHARYLDGERDLAFLKDYIQSSRYYMTNERQPEEEYLKQFDHTAAVTKDYLQRMPKQKLIDAAHFDMITAVYMEETLDHEMVQFVADNYDAYAEKMGEEIVSRFVLGGNSNTTQTLAKKGDRNYLKYINPLGAGPKAKSDNIYKAADFMNRKDPEFHLFSRGYRIKTKLTYLGGSKQWKKLDLITQYFNDASMIMSGARILLTAEAKEYKEKAIAHARRAFWTSVDSPWLFAEYIAMLKKVGKTKEADQLVKEHMDEFPDQEGMNQLIEGMARDL